MVAALDEACHLSMDPPDDTPLIVSQRTVTGFQGRPRVDIAYNFLKTALKWSTITQIAAELKCCTRTVRRRAEEYGLVDPQPPVFESVEEEDGSITTYHTSSTAPNSTLPDEELILLVARCHQLFPYVGRKILDGFLQARGHRVQRDRVTAAFRAVNGAPRIFGGREIQRRAYRVAGPNSLWHHDGQHGE